MLSHQEWETTVRTTRIVHTDKGLHCGLLWKITPGQKQVMEGWTLHVLVECCGEGQQGTIIHCLFHYSHSTGDGDERVVG